MELCADSYNKDNKYNSNELFLNAMPFVFRFLPMSQRGITSRVCRAWHRAFSDEISWSVVSLRALKYPVFEALTTLSVKSILSLVVSLDLEFTESTNDDCLHLLSQQATQLISLNLNMCQKVTADGLIELSSSCTQLTSLSLYWIPRMEGRGADAVASHCTKLQSLCLSGCKHIGDSTMKLLAQNHVSNLTLLDLTRLPLVTDIGLSAISTICGRLKKLVLYASCGFTDDGLQQLVSNCPLLEYIDICGNGKLSDATFANPQTLKNLKWLNISWCPAFSDTTLIAMGQHCNKLQAIFFLGNKNMTLAGLTAMAQGCPDIRSLDMQGCIGIEDRSMTAMRQLFPKLKYLAKLGDAPNYR